MRLLGAIAAFFAIDFMFHMMEAFAAGLKADTPLERIGAVFGGLAILLVLMAVFYRLFSKSFFHGFTVAAGLFLSFDIVVFHWIFQLHRITNGPEANWLEPVFVVCGVTFVVYGVKQERGLAKNRQNKLNVGM